MNEKFGIKASNDGDDIATRGRSSIIDNEGGVRWRLRSQSCDGRVLNLKMQKGMSHKEVLFLKEEEG